MMTTGIKATAAGRQLASGDDRLLSAIALALVAFLLLAILLPLAAFLVRGVVDGSWSFIGLANFAAYLGSPSLLHSARNSLFVATVSTGITVSLALVYAYALTRSCMPLKPLFRAIALIPLLAPSLLAAISLIYLFGNNGLLKPLMLGHSIYGPIGIIAGEVIATFPHALLILVTALSLIDGRLYEASSSLGASGIRTFFTVTFPAIRYGLVSCSFVVFTMTITDFGVPKVIGGAYAVLATDVYKQVVGWQNFEMGAVTGTLLLLPALLSFVVDRVVRRRQTAALSARAVPFEPRPRPVFDFLMALACSAIGLCLVVIVAIAVFASLATFWPYNLSLTLANYDFDRTTDIGWMAYWNSFRMAGLTAIFGTVVIFLGAYVGEKARHLEGVRGFIQFMAMLPMAIPGIVLGLGYIFFFNYPLNPLSVAYGTIWILVLNCIAHFYTVPHLAASTALQQLDREFEAVSASLRVPVLQTFLRVTVPVCLPTILNISVYLFVNAMTTVSAVVFLYTPGTLVASVSVLYLDDNGVAAPAAAMAIMIVVTSAAMRLLHWLATHAIERRTQAWRRVAS